MTDVPDSLPEDIGADVEIDPKAPYANAKKGIKDLRKEAQDCYLKQSKGTPWEAFSKAIVAASDSDVKDKVTRMMEIMPVHPTIACAALSHFIFDIERGLIGFGDEEQRKQVLDGACQAIGIFSHLADPETLP